MSLEWIFIEIFVNIVEVGALFYLLCNKFKAKYNSFIPTFLFIIGAIVLLSIPIFIFFKGLPITEILLVVTCFVYLFIFRVGNILNKIFWTLISFAILVSLALFSTTIVSVISSITSANLIGVMQSSTERLFILTIAKTLQIVIFYILTKKNKELNPKRFLAPMSLLVCFVIPFLSIILGFYINYLIHKYASIPDKLIFAIFTGYLAINIIVFVLYEIINREAGKNYILIAKQKQYELTEQHNRQIMDIYDKIREWRHDYTHHMQLIVGMLEKSDSDNSETINYIKNLDEKIKSTSLEIVTGNLIVDAIVSAKATLASVYGITLEHNILLPENVSIENTDLCSILSNLLDNAIEACCKLEQSKYINLEMLSFKNQFNIKITNASNGEYNLENGKLKTTKNSNLHGIGIGYVKSIVESYGGIFDIKPESDSFTTYVSIPLARNSVS